MQGKSDCWEGILGLRTAVSRGILRARCTPLLARVVKLVDTGDLKSPGHCGRAGSSPAPGTIINRYKTRHINRPLVFGPAEAHRRLTSAPLT